MVRIVSLTVVVVVDLNLPNQNGGVSKGSRKISSFFGGPTTKILTILRSC